MLVAGIIMMIMVIIMGDCLYFSFHFPTVDCEVEDWSSWSDCSATCGGGTKTRGRGVVQEAENGGAACPTLEEEEPCNTDQCPGYILFM